MTLLLACLLACYLVHRLITVSDGPDTVPVLSSKVRNLLLLSSRGSHTYLILPLIICFNLVNDREGANSPACNLLARICATETQQCITVTANPISVGVSSWA